MALEPDGWDTTGIPKHFWPHVRDVLVARELYLLSTLVSDKAVGEGLQRTAHGVLIAGAKAIAAGSAQR